MGGRAPSTKAIAGRACLVSIALACAWACISVPDSPDRDRGPSVKLAASFSPERLGKGTTIRIGFHVAYPSGEAPLAATAIQFFYPPGWA